MFIIFIFYDILCCLHFFFVGFLKYCDNTVTYIIIMIKSLIHFKCIMYIWTLEDAACKGMFVCMGIWNMENLSQMGLNKDYLIRGDKWRI